MRGLRIFLPLLAALCLFSGPLWAKEAAPAIKVKAGLDKQEAGIGEKIKYSIAVVMPKDAEIEFPDAGKLFKDFTIKDSGLTTRTFFGKKKLLQSYFLDSFLPGEYVLPKTPIKYKVKGQNEWKELEIPEFSIKVRSALEKAGTSPALRDIKGPLRLKQRLSIFLLFGLLILLAVSILGLTLLPGKKDAADITPQRPAHEIAYEQLEALKKKGLIQQGRVKEYFSEISDIIRHYLENRFLVKAPEMTTEEFLIFVRDYARLIVEHKALLREFLSACDLVKFAKFTPSAEEAEGVFDSARKFVDQTKEEAALK